MASIEILMATYNGARFVCEQIESIQSQSYTDWRLLVSDDCSSDETVELIQGIAEADSRIKIVSEGIRHGSAKANFMGLLSKSTAPYVMFCDQDDVWLPRKVELTLSKMMELEKANSLSMPLMVFTDMKIVDKELKVIHESFEKFSHINPMRIKFPQLLAQSVGAGCTMMVNRMAVEQAIKAPDYSDMIMHDWWLSLVCSAFGAIAHVDEPTSLYRQHGDNEVGANALKISSWINRFDEMANSQIRLSRQSNAFVRVYGDKLSPKQKGSAERCAKIYSSSSAVGLFNLFISRTWKCGARRLGQIIAVLLIGSRCHCKSLQNSDRRNAAFKDGERV